jgi:hypothetical protein
VKRYDYKILEHQWRRRDEGNLGGGDDHTRDMR